MATIRRPRRTSGEEFGDVDPSGEEFIRRIAEPDPAVVAQLDNPDQITTRILAAALEQAELVGMRRSTMEDVARRSGVGRATLYRRSPPKLR